MCGIAGVAALDPRARVDAGALAGMIACVRHRGPDDEGFMSAPGIALGHCRLAVIDVAGGQQPLRGQRESTIAVVNGEVYNYRELAAELLRHGSRFRSASDSEVVAHAYDVWGTDCFDRFDGMFAVALWDGERRRLILARDRMGEKPLFYTRTDGLLVFASELSAILAHPAVERTVDPCALREYLALEYVPAPNCLVRGVEKLEPGSTLILEDGVVVTNRYWRIRPGPAGRAQDYREQVAALRAHLEHAVHSRLVSDVPLGVFLSGGIDSSTVAAVAARHGTVDTFSIGFEEASFDESRHARAVAQHIGSRHHERIVRADEMPELVPRLGTLLDEPIGDASVLPTHVLSRFAREYVTVALGGDGGDELFAGYPMHQAHRVAGIVRSLPRPILAAASRAVAALPVSHGNFTLGFRARTFLRGAAEPAPLNHALWMASFPPDEHEQLLHPDLLHNTGSCDPLETMHRYWAESAGAAPLARAAHLDATTYLPNDILVKVDRASMAVALEVRAPFLARNMVEFAFSLPDSARMRGVTGKRVLRDAVRDLLPPEILRRPKKGFGIPVAAWINGPLRALVHDLLSADSVERAGLFRPAAVQRMLAAHTRGERDLRKPIWTLLVLELWRRERIERRSGAAPCRAPA